MSYNTRCGLLVRRVCLITLNGEIMEFFFVDLLGMILREKGAKN